MLDGFWYAKVYFEFVALWCVVSFFACGKYLVTAMNEEMGCCLGWTFAVGGLYYKHFNGKVAASD
jgi:hypothetical protein